MALIEGFVTTYESRLPIDYLYFNKLYLPQYGIFCHRLVNISSLFEKDFQQQKKAGVLPPAKALHKVAILLHTWQTYLAASA